MLRSHLSLSEEEEYLFAIANTEEAFKQLEFNTSSVGLLGSEEKSDDEEKKEAVGSLPISHGRPDAYGGV